MVNAARDRVTIDLRSIGDALRAAAASRGTTIAALARGALLDVVKTPSTPTEPARSSAGTQTDVVKLTLRLPAPTTELLSCNAAALGLSYGA